MPPTAHATWHNYLGWTKVTAARRPPGQNGAVLSAPWEFDEDLLLYVQLQPLVERWRILINLEPDWVSEWRAGMHWISIRSADRFSQACLEMTRRCAEIAVRCPDSRRPGCPLLGPLRPDHLRWLRPGERFYVGWHALVPASKICLGRCLDPLLYEVLLTHSPLQPGPEVARIELERWGKSVERVNAWFEQDARAASRWMLENYFGCLDTLAAVARQSPLWQRSPERVHIPPECLARLLEELGKVAGRSVRLRLPADLLLRLARSPRPGSSSDAVPLLQEICRCANLPAWYDFGYWRSAAPDNLAEAVLEHCFETSGSGSTRPEATRQWLRLEHALRYPPAASLLFVLPRGRFKRVRDQLRPDVREGLLHKKRWSDCDYRVAEGMVAWGLPQLEQLADIPDEQLVERLELAYDQAVADQQAILADLEAGSEEVLSSVLRWLSHRGFQAWQLLKQMERAGRN